MRFYQFVEAIKSPGLIHVNGEVMQIEDEEKEKIIKATPLVFLPKGHDLEVNNISLDAPLDLPFKDCFFEMLEDSITEIVEDGQKIRIVGIYVHENAPYQYEMMAMMRIPGDSRCSIFYPGGGDSAVTQHFLKIITSLLERLKTDEVGFNNPRTVVKLKIRGKKIQHRLSRVVYVSPKSMITKMASKIPRAIDWSHRWTVRGHWRSMPGRIGKDREGLPIMNATWVRPYEKGPDNAPLVSKVRVVK